MNYEEEQISKYKTQIRHLENIKFMFNHMQKNHYVYAGRSQNVKKQVDIKINDIKDILEMGILDEYLSKVKQIITNGERGHQFITYFKIISNGNWNKFEPPNEFYKSLFNKDLSVSYITTEGWSGEGCVWFAAEILFIKELLQDVYHEYNKFCKNCALYRPGGQGALKCKESFDMAQFNIEATKIKKLN